MSEPKRPLKVFLCHAHADRDSVRKLYSRLTQDGVDAWLDKAKLLPGQDWELEIRRAVREADVVVVCLSQQFNQAGFRQKEVHLALDTAMEKPEGEIFIIPARLEECEEFLILRRWHWVDLFEDDGYELLMLALRARADKIHVTLQTKRNGPSKINTPPSIPIEKLIEVEQEKTKSKKKKSTFSSKSILAITTMFFIVSSIVVVFAFFPTSWVDVFFSPTGVVAPSSTVRPEQNTPSPFPQVIPLTTTLPEVVITSTPNTIVAYVKYRNTKLKEGPDLRFKSVNDVAVGDECELIARYNSWYLVTCSSGKSGWLAVDWLEISADVNLDNLKVLTSSDILKLSPECKKYTC